MGRPQRCPSKGRVSRASGPDGSPRPRSWVLARRQGAPRPLPPTKRLPKAVHCACSAACTASTALPLPVRCLCAGLARALIFSPAATPTTTTTTNPHTTPNPPLRGHPRTAATDPQAGACNIAQGRASQKASCARQPSALSLPNPADKPLSPPLQLISGQGAPCFGARVAPPPTGRGALAPSAPRSHRMPRGSVQHAWGASLGHGLHHHCTHIRAQPVAAC